MCKKGLEMLPPEITDTPENTLIFQTYHLQRELMNYIPCSYHNTVIQMFLRSILKLLQVYPVPIVGMTPFLCSRLLLLKSV